MSSSGYAATTSRAPTRELRSAALEWAERLGVQFVPRADRSLAAICREQGVTGLLTVTRERVVFVIPDEGFEFFFHPNMARTRIRTLRDGRGDPMVAAMALQPGDQVLDCTLGRGSDAIVASWVVGESVRVVGLEVVPLVAELTIHGLRTYELAGAGLMEAMRRIEARQGDHEQVLPALPGACFDVVYFDPFFHEPVAESQAMASLRRVGEHRELRPAALREARRVARRCVVIKQRREGPFRDLPGVERVAGGAGRRVEYVVIGAVAPANEYQAPD